MAKLIGLRPESSKMRLRLQFTTEFNFDDLLDEIDKNIPGFTVGAKNHSEYHFRIVGVDVQALADSGAMDGFHGVKIFGRGYTFVPRANKLDASLRTAATEFYGLWHDSQFIKSALDKGASSGANEIKIVEQWDDAGSTKAEFTSRIIVDVVMKDMKSKG